MVLPSMWPASGPLFQILLRQFNISVFVSCKHPLSSVSVPLSLYVSVSLSLCVWLSVSVSSHVSSPLYLLSLGSNCSILCLKLFSMYLLTFCQVYFTLFLDFVHHLYRATHSLFTSNSVFLPSFSPIACTYLCCVASRNT